MKYFLFISSLLIIMATQLPSALAQDCTWEKSKGKDVPLVQNRGYLQYWIAKPVAICIPANKRVNGKTIMMVTITHKTDKSPYACGQTFPIQIEKTDYATQESWAIEECQ